MTRIIALFDMDGTLFDFDGQLRSDLLRTAAPGEEHLFHPGSQVSLWQLEKKYPYVKARMDLIKSQPGWWRDLPRHEPGWEILGAAEEIGFEIHILTKGPSSKPHAWAEKLECVRKNLGFVQVHITEDKSVHYGRVLVDDYPPYVEAWLEHRPRGQVIMPAQQWNAGFEHQQVLRYHGENYQAVCDTLAAVYDRVPA